MDINCRISSDLDNLSRYNSEYNWIPGPHNIRPDKDTIIAKQELFNTVHYFYENMTDYILSEIFNYPVEFNEQGKLEVNINHVVLLLVMMEDSHLLY